MMRDTGCVYVANYDKANKRTGITEVIRAEDRLLPLVVQARSEDAEVGIVQLSIADDSHERALAAQRNGHVVPKTVIVGRWRRVKFVG